MKFAIQRCCSTPVYLKQYETSTDAVFRKLGVDIVDIKETGCCGYPLKNINFNAFVLSSARNLALAEKKDLNMWLSSLIYIIEVMILIYFLFVNGTYLFTVSILSGDRTVAVVGLYVNGVRVASVYSDGRGDVGNYGHATSVVFVKCEHQDKVWVRSEFSSTVMYGSSEFYTTFSGMLVKAE